MYISLQPQQQLFSEQPFQHEMRNRWGCSPIRKHVEHAGLLYSLKSQRQFLVAIHSEEAKETDLTATLEH